jgi:hypothetical protein
MRIIVEGYDPELLEDIQEQHAEEQSTLDEVRQLLLDADFDEEKKLNGVAFVKEYDEDEVSIKAQMYIDTTSFDYSCYVSSSSDEENKSDFSSKGKYDTLVTAAKRLIFEVNGI